MNTLIREAASTAQMGWLLGIMTALFIAFFVAWTWWAYNPKNKARMDEAAQMPFDDGVER